jgi:hypothetical protein
MLLQLLSKPRRLRPRKGEALIALWHKAASTTLDVPNPLTVLFR